MTDMPDEIWAYRTEPGWKTGWRDSDYYGGTRYIRAEYENRVRANYEAEIARLRRIIEEADHAPDCGIHPDSPGEIWGAAKARKISWNGLDYECDCWKSRIDK